MIVIILNNNKCKIQCTRKTLLKLIKDFKIKHKNAFHIRRFMPLGWDGKIKYVTDAGYISTGLLPKLCSYLKANDLEYEFDDRRDVSVPARVEHELNGKTLRPYQVEAVESVISNKIDNLPFPRGIIKAATNGGKTIIAAGIHKSYGLKTIWLINSSELFNDALVDMPGFLPGEVGQISSKKIEWNNFMVCMAQTFKNRLTSYSFKREVEKYQVALIDECDLAGNKTYKVILNTGLYNCFVKIGLSGTALMNDDKNKNETIRGNFGEELYAITNRKLMDLGFSSEVEVKILLGNEDPMNGMSYDEQYELGIIKNKQRNLKVYKRLKLHCIKRGRVPALVITKNHAHIKLLYNLLRKKFKGKLTVDYVHHKKADRKEVIQNFKEGKLDILIGSNILKRGKNFPLMKYMINAGGGKGVEQTLQALGRATRNHTSKKKTYYEDFYDEGIYLRRHSKRRIIAYKNEQLKVLEKYKNTINNK